MMKYVPNALTIFRIVLVPVFVWLVFFFEPHHTGLPLGLAVFVIASITDWLDGSLARRFGIISDFGKLMDPLADKLLVTAVLAALMLPPLSAISVWVVAIIVAREVVVTILRKVYASRGIVVAANIWGKLKTVLQMAGGVAALAWFAALPWWEALQGSDSGVRLAIRIYFWIVAAVTVLSGMNFLRATNKET
ncbi:MAG: CDP-diacylglycerol--glycerol-3-phosphate 3-phosphatidyltransferase [Candidatus Cloacimonetes bacterium]|nr:CDP-diacylglycerol--glycerol-3-phosphate 3-phosphatidyltransferase [Candidatus Cloacimonadota bacterium]